MSSRDCMLKPLVLPVMAGELTGLTGGGSAMPCGARLVDASLNEVFTVPAPEFQLRALLYS